MKILRNWRYYLPTSRIVFIMYPLEPKIPCWIWLLKIFDISTNMLEIHHKWRRRNMKATYYSIIEKGATSGCIMMAWKKWNGCIIDISLRIHHIHSELANLFMLNIVFNMNRSKLVHGYEISYIWNLKKCYHSFHSEKNTFSDPLWFISDTLHFIFRKHLNLGAF